MGKRRFLIPLLFLASSVSANISTDLPTAAEVNDLSSIVTWDDIPDANVPSSAVTQHEALLTITESQISDLGTYLTDVTGQNLESLADVTITTIASGELLKWNGSAWINNTLAEAGISAVGHTHTEADITDLQSYLTAEVNDLSTVTWVNVPDANITQSSVTQHQSALTITESQISDLQSYLTSVQLSDLTDVNTSTVTNRNVLVADGVDWESRPLVEADISDLQSYLTSFTESNNLGASVTWANIPDANVPSTAVTQHQASLSITESQISDLGPYDPAGTDNSTDVTLAGALDYLTIVGQVITRGLIDLTTDVTGLLPASSGALLDSEVTNLAQVKAFDSADYATAAQGTTADSAMQDLADDTSPQLGGNLDVTGNNIITTGNGTINIYPGGTGNVEVGNFKFNADQIIGLGQNDYVPKFDSGTDEINLEQIYEVPAGGTTGQVLKKDSGTDHDYSWQDDSTGGGGGGNEFWMVIWAEENASLGGSNTFEWAFGNGANIQGAEGLGFFEPSGYDCFADAMTIVAGNTSTTATVELYVNNTALGASNGAEVVLTSGQKANNDFTDYALATGDNITFRTRSSSGTASANVVALYVRCTEQ